MDWTHLFTSFHGRISRKPFWIGWIVLVALEVAVALLTGYADSDRLGNVLDLILTYPEFAVAAKRGHDRNIPTWVVGLFFALSAAFDLFGLAGYDATLKSYGNVAYLVFIPIGFLTLILFVDLGFRRGSQGPNRFGPDPLATPDKP